jgi:hypothetical protein
MSGFKDGGQVIVPVLLEFTGSDSQARCSLTIGLFSPAFKEGKI